VLGIVGTLIWLAERKENPEQFPRRPVPGIANGVWFALVTMTTVGYGDRVPTTTAGRVVAGVWMVVALLTASSLTAGIATAITVAQLAPSRVASAAHRAGGRVSVVSAFEEGVERVATGAADAFVFDRPMLRYYLRKNPELELGVSEASYVTQGYGFAVADADLQHTLDVALLHVTEDGVVKRVTTEWLGASAEDDR
jgi:polar amino acid transport system substrate-binding protein